jgi:hypothetical protein
MLSNSQSPIKAITMQFNYKIPLTLSIIIGILVTSYGNTLTAKDYNYYNPEANKVLGVKVPQLVSFLGWFSSFTVRKQLDDGSEIDIFNRIIGLVFFGMIVGLSYIPIGGAYLLLVKATKINLN